MAISDLFSHLLKSRKLSVTQQRLALLQILSGDHVCLGVDDLVALAKKRKKTIGDWSTVYRTLKIFEESKLVSAHSFKDGITRYELNEEADHAHHHHHFVCTDCGAIFPIAHCSMDPYEKEAKKSGFKILDHVLEIQGKCKKCH